MPTASEDPPAAPPHDAEGIQDYITRLQRDGRLLLRFVARRVDRGLLPDTPAGATNDGQPSDALFAPAADVLKSPDRLADLLRCVDDLSRRAAPANVRSIRLTSAYLAIAIEGGEPPLDIDKEARSVRRCMRLVGSIAIVLLLMSIGLLAHMDNGRRLLQQLAAMRLQEQDVQRDLAALPLIETRVRSITIRERPDGPALLVSADPDVIAPAPAPATADTSDGVPLCAAPTYGAARKEVTVTDIRAISPESPSPQNQLFSWREPITQKALALCRRYDDNKVRLAIVYTGLADWNCLSHKIFSPYAVEPWLWSTPEAACGTPAVKLPPEIDQTTWQSHEIWVSATTAVVAGFILPLLLGCLGGCAYALRRVDNKLSNWTLEPHDGRHALSRVALAALLGGLVGVVWTSGDTITLGGFTLSLAAAAFFIGFSVEGVFKVIENLINNVTGSIGTSGMPPAVPVKGR